MSDSDSSGGELYVRNATKRRKFNNGSQHPANNNAPAMGGKKGEEGKTLVDIYHDRLRKGEIKQLTAEEQVQEEEAYLLANLTNSRASLLGAKQAASGNTHKESVNTKWRPTQKHLHKMTSVERRKVREHFHIIAEGTNLPPPCVRFKMMRVAGPILSALRASGIKKPSPIQIQGLPVALSGRDMIGIAFTGSGKTLCFTLPMIMIAYREHAKMPFQRGEGPACLTLSPSRELTRQTYDVCKQYACLDGMPHKLSVLLVTGGMNMREQVEIAAKDSDGQEGFHIVCATPGRLLGCLKQGTFSMRNCKYLCLDEADRLIDLGFEEDVRSIFDAFSSQRQTLLFSATMPKRIQEFALESLVRPVVVNVGRAGSANMDVIQEVEYVKPEQRVLYMLECLKKTAPPTVVFASNQGDVDDIHEYLLLKGVPAAAVHGKKSMEDRIEAIRQFKSYEKAVLVATDVASKGLDFPDIQHVINFDMPREIEDYVHRIGRTGRAGNTGVATTFINRDSDDLVLRDLKALLTEAKQKIPPVLMHMTKDDMLEEGVACGYCGGLGHRVQQCPKLKKTNKVQHHSEYDFAQSEY
jgi:ATP-dependent RNA helicase DDX41